jgi:hypothetical protein
MYTGPGIDDRTNTYCEVVTRTIAAPAVDVAAGLTSMSTGPHPPSFDLGPLGRLCLAGPVRSVDGTSTWQALGRLYPDRPLVARYVRVEIEVSAWSGTACELSLRPRCRHIRRWSERRWGRYFDLARAGVNALAEALSASIPVHARTVPAPVSPIAAAA